MQNKNTKIKIPFATFGLDKERGYFIENLAMLVSSGMPIVSSINSISSEIKSLRMKRILVFIKEDIESGAPLWRALEDSNLFKPHTISLVKLGEESGKLVENLRVITGEEQKDRVLTSKIRSAMLYPVFVLSVSVVVGVGISWFILPKLAVVFAQLKIKLPFITKVLINTGVFLEKYGYFFVPIFLGVIATIIFFLFFFPKTKHNGQIVLFLIPGVKELMKEIEIAKFGYLLGTLLQAGLPIIKSLDSISKATEFIRYRKLYEHLGHSVEEGNSLQKSFASYPNAGKLIPMPIQQLIVVGEQSGNLSKTLIEVGTIFENKADITTKNLTIILEPVLLVIVWVGVVGVALAVILPIYSLVGGISNSL